jgi:hypothetical protein
MKKQVLPMTGFSIGWFILGILFLGIVGFLIGTYLNKKFEITS